MNPWSSPWFDSWQNLTSNQPWQTALDSWWSQFSGQSPPSPYLQAFENIVAQSQSMFELAEQFNKTSPSGPAATDWQVGVEQIFDSLKKAFDSGELGQAPHLFWQMPLANWQRTASSLSGLPGDMFADLSSRAGGDPNTKLNQILSTPGVGYAREYQGEHQKFARLLVDYQNVMQKYTQVIVAMNSESLNCMRDRLIARMEAGDEPIESVLELYNLWVECSEEVYGRRVLSDEYGELHGDMINTLMALKRQGSRMMDDAAGAMNMPTRTEVDTMQERFHVARRREKALERKVSDLSARESMLEGGIDGLRQKLRRLEDIVITGSGPPASKKTLSKKKAVKKKAVKKKAVKKKAVKKKAVKKNVARKKASNTRTRK